jgi:uracil-DNA glycosylase
MARTLDTATRSALSARIEYYKELGIHDFYSRQLPASNEVGEANMETMKDTRETSTEGADSGLLLQAQIEDHAAALDAIREDLGDCKRCPLHKQGRKQIVFGAGNPDAELMFVGEGPGADEDEQGLPFVGRAGQLLNNMITAMGLRREDVYIANIVKCRPPGNRTPEPEECAACSVFLLRQIDVVRPKALVALGAVAARTLLGMNKPMIQLRGLWFDFRGIPLAVTYHPAYLLRDPRQKGEAWKDLQMVMRHLGLPMPEKKQD